MQVLLLNPRGTQLQVKINIIIQVDKLIYLISSNYFEYEF